MEGERRGKCAVRGRHRAFVAVAGADLGMLLSGHAGSNKFMKSFMNLLEPPVGVEPTTPALQVEPGAFSSRENGAKIPKNQRSEPHLICCGKAVLPTLVGKIWELWSYSVDLALAPFAFRSGPRSHVNLSFRDDCQNPMKGRYLMAQPLSLC